MVILNHLYVLKEIRLNVWWMRIYLSFQRHAIFYLIAYIIRFCIRLLIIHFNNHLQLISICSINYFILFYFLITKFEFLFLINLIFTNLEHIFFRSFVSAFNFWYRWHKICRICFGNILSLFWFLNQLRFTFKLLVTFGWL